MYFRWYESYVIIYPDGKETTSISSKIEAEARG